MPIHVGEETTQARKLFVEESSPERDRLARGETHLVGTSEHDRLARGSNALVGTSDSFAAEVVVPHDSGYASGSSVGGNVIINGSTDDAFLFAAGRDFVHASTAVAKYAGLDLH